MASYRKSKLNDNSAFLQFNWKADVVESWIGKNKLVRAVCRKTKTKVVILS